MKYIITKTILEKYNYYLDIFGRWTGLKDNAKIYSDFDVVQEKIFLLKKKKGLVSDKFDFIEENYFIYD